MKVGTAALLLVALAGCRRQPSAAAHRSGQAAFRPLDTEEKIARATLALLASDGKPVCVERETIGSPLSVWRIATQGKLQDLYDLAWFPPKAFRPAAQPSLDALRSAARAGRKAELAEPEARRDRLPDAVQRRLQAQAAALASPETPVRRVAIRAAWAPAGVLPRWWLVGAARHGCTAHYILSGTVWDAHAAFVGVRVEHWGTVFALAPQGNDWRPIAQWGTWLY